jgi:hypothetical protein
MLATVYAAHGAPVPALLLLHPDGRRLARAPYETWTVSQSVSDFKAIYARELDGVATEAGTPGGQSNRPPATAEIRWEPPSAKPVYYAGLKLRNISGTRARRFALINDQTLMQGETAKVMSDGARVSVSLVEIGEDSVRIRVQGEQEPRVLTLKAAH